MLLELLIMCIMPISEVQIVEKPSLELFREVIMYVNENLNESGFRQIATDTPFHLEKAEVWQKALLEGNQICAVAVKSGKVVGASHLDIWHGRRKHTARLAITVGKNHRRQGIANALMRSIIDQAKKKRIKVIIAEPSEDNVAAISLLKKFGFREGGRIKKGFKSDDGTLKDLISLQAFL